MEWFRIEISTSREKHEEAAELLIDSGCCGVEIVDPSAVREAVCGAGSSEYADNNLLPQDVTNVRVIGYLENKADLDIVIESLIGFETAVSVVRESDWEDNWKKFAGEIEIGEKIVICPSHLDIKNDTVRKVIRIDPGIAFGTGEHETTFMCAGFLEKLVRKGDSVLDVGTGSGILAIIAAKLGASCVKAVDTDKYAVNAAKENIAANHTSLVTDVEIAEAGMLGRKKYDIIVANIMTKVLIDIKEELKKRLKKNGVLVLSGILNDKYGRLLEEYESAGFRLADKNTINEWTAVVFYA